MNKFKFISSLLALIVLVQYSCTKDEESNVNFDDSPYQLNIGNLPAPNIALDNLLTMEGVKLGRMLFYEKRLSRTNTQSCASCHKQENAFSDTAKFSQGVSGDFGGRQAMAVFNMAWNTNQFFWDGRAHLLRDQSLGPIENPVEMDETLENVIAKLSQDQDYKDQFVRAFGAEEITATKMSLAMEQFMNSIVSVNSKYDRFLAGTDSLTPSENRGRSLFFDEFNPGFPELSGADCAHCHGGKTFENDLYMNNGLDGDAGMEDDGRMEVTDNPNDKGKFKVTSLRNVEVTPPYMHDGRFATLEEVINHYNNGLKNSSTISPALEYTRSSGGLQLTQEDKADLVLFLKTLTDDVLLTNEEYSDPF
jgi:cytochrome c peroxidase